MVYAKKVGFRPSVKNLESAENIEKGAEYENILIAFIHAEAQDEEDLKETEKKLVKNIKWGARKNETNRILLHSFAHLAASKASPEFTKEVFDKAEERLKNANYEVFQTPFGYFLDMNMDWYGYSQARIFREFNRVKCNDEDNNQNGE